MNLCPGSPGLVSPKAFIMTDGIGSHLTITAPLLLKLCPQFIVHAVG